MSQEVELVNLEIVESVDAVSRSRVAHLCAHGLTDGKIADVLLLSITQIVEIKKTSEFKEEYHRLADEIIQRQVDLDEGWDLVEELSVATLAKTLEFNRDPKFALFAARTANQAKRRGNSGIDKGKNEQPIIDGTKQQSNVIQITLNRTYINRITDSESKAIDVTARQLAPPLKQADLPSSKHVENLLAPVRSGQKHIYSELEEAMAIAGVFVDKDNG
jgi:hypothetical protein